MNGMAENSIDELAHFLIGVSHGQEHDGKLVQAMLAAQSYVFSPKSASGSMRAQFLLLPSSDQLQVVLPVYLDRQRAEKLSAGRVEVVGLAVRELFELSQGTTLEIVHGDVRFLLSPQSIRSILGQACSAPSPKGAVNESFGANRRFE